MSRYTWSLLLVLLGLALAPTAQARERAFTLRAGPYEMGNYRTEFPDQVIKTPGLDGYLTEFNARLVHRDGTPVPVNQTMLHHLYVRTVNRSRTDDCGTARSESFYGTGEENEQLDLPDGYGYRVHAGDRWQLGAMLMAHRYATHRVYVQYTGKIETDRRLTGVRPYWIRAGGCPGHIAYDVPGGGAAGQVDDRVKHWTVPKSGRIVASGGHLHAGALALQLRDPGCGNRLLFDNTPFYAPADDMMYTAVPRLHEAGPVQASWFSSVQGIPVTKGQTLDLHGVYEAGYARQLVMAITHVYLAPGPAPDTACPPLPTDRRQAPMQPGLRRHAPYEPIPLYKLDARKKPVQLAEPEGPVRKLPEGGTVDIADYRFTPSRIVVRAGATVHWSFGDVDPHNIILASGPRTAGGQYGARGATGSDVFAVPGRYQFFCSLHPMLMHEQVDVVP